MNSTDEAEISTEAAYTAGFSTQDMQYLLHDSFILDSGLTLHICNDCQQFEDFAKASDSVHAGEGHAGIKGYGTVRIKVTRPSRETSLKLTQVAYIPHFQTNIVSLWRLKQKSINWDLERGILTLNDKLFCQVFEKYNQFVIEYNPTAAFPANSRKPRPPLHRTVDLDNNEGTTKIQQDNPTGLLTPLTDTNRYATPIESEQHTDMELPDID